MRVRRATMADGDGVSVAWEDGEMALPAATLDHVVINARDDMDRAAETYRRLGFTLTERGYHSLGSMNHLAMFGTDYLELIAVPKGATSGRLDLLTYATGLNGLVFGSEDSAATYAAVSTAGVPIDAPVEFTRPVRIDGQDRDARFRTVRMKAGVPPYGRVYFCHHFTRDLVWRDEWRHHANGVVAVARVMIVEPDPAAAVRLYADMFGSELVRDIDGGKALIVGNARVDIVNEPTLRRQFGDACPHAEGRTAYMAGLTLRTTSLAKSARALRDGGIAGVVDGNDRLVVPAAQAFNATLEFIQ
ncbi:VOC family protein [Reyranella sp. CPCC 100927]|uniref:VOC family protein n=1 Tax=Reyranella sp. CPCC 100927 TaxID=2599616 RepID=UPI0015B69327|nr:VOC family protein [Reyranella sp. CPCC 100927]